MQFLARPLKARGRAAGPVFSVVAIHDDFSGSVRAQEALEWLQHSLGSDLHVRSVSWSFQKLERMDLRAMSVRAAAAADVIIVAASDTRAVPDQVRRWLDSSLQQQRGNRALLVALHDEDQDDAAPPGPLCSHLKRLAARWQTEFLCNDDFDRRLDHDFALRFIHQKADTSLRPYPPFGIDFFSAPECGGINE